MPELLSAFIGGFLALLGVWLTGVMHRKQKIEDGKKDEISFIKSVKCEIIALLKLLEERHADIVNGNLGEEGFFRFEHAVSSNYLSFFDGNMSNLMKINEDEIRIKIQELVLYTRSYLDSHTSHSQLLEEVTKFEYYCHRNPDDELSKQYLARNKEAIKEFDVSLITQAKDLQEKARKLEALLEHYF